MKIRDQICAYLIILTCIASPIGAFLRPIPSAGVVEREIEKEYESRPIELEKKEPALQIDIPESRLDIPDGKKISIQDVVIRGNESFSCRTLNSLISDCLNQDLSIKDIYQICIVIDQFYAQNGYFLARAYPPPQTIENGVLTIEIIEGKLGNVYVEGNCFYSKAFIHSYFAHLLNKPLQHNEFMKALLLLNDNDDLFAGAIFQKGKEFGTGDVILRIQDHSPRHLYLNANNYGRDLTTNTRFGGRLDYGNLLTYGDKLSIADVLGLPINALYFTDIIYNVPLNRYGTSLEFAYLSSRFKIEELESLHLKGTSEIGTIKINQALIRRRFLSVDLFSYFDYKEIENFVFDFRSSFDRLRVLTFGSLIDYFDPLGGRNYLTFRVGAGLPNILHGLHAVDDECSRRGAGGQFVKLNLDYDRLQSISMDSFLYLHGSAQWSPFKLALPEEFYIGGEGTVRGYPLAVALGDSGYCVNCELRFPPPYIANKKVFMLDKTWKEIIQLDVFLDNGGTFLRSDRSTILWGTGFGARIIGPYNSVLSVDIGFPINHQDLSKEVFVYIKLTAQPF